MLTPTWWILSKVISMMAQEMTVMAASTILTSRVSWVCTVRALRLSCSWTLKRLRMRSCPMSAALMKSQVMLAMMARLNRWFMTSREAGGNT